MSEESTTPTPKLAAALVKAQSAAGNVKPDAKNQHQGFSYASAEAIIAEARKALNGAGLAFTLAGYRVFSPDPESAPATVYKRQGGEETHPIWLLDATYLLAHESGEMLRVEQAGTPIVPGPGRPVDKALNAALTTSHKYALIQLLALPRSDGEVCSRDDEGSRSGTHSGKAGPFPNKFAAPCVHCSDTVEPGDGRSKKDDAGKWVTIHDACLEVVERKRAERGAA